jgi:hypothetical protein
LRSSPARAAQKAPVSKNNRQIHKQTKNEKKNPKPKKEEKELKDRLHDREQKMYN